MASSLRQRLSSVQSAFSRNRQKGSSLQGRSAGIADPEPIQVLGGDPIEGEVFAVLLSVPSLVGYDKDLLIRVLDQALKHGYHSQVRVIDVKGAFFRGI